MTAPRIAPGGVAEMGPVNWLLCRMIGRAAGTEDAHLFRTLARQRRLFRAWLVFAAGMMPGGTISRRETELVILRVAHLRRCGYELDHHRRVARRAGVTPAEIERVFAGPDAPGWSEPDRALLAAVDAIVATRELDDPTWAALRAHLDEPQLVELCLLIGHYELLATTIAALRIPRDRMVSDRSSGRRP